MERNFTIICDCEHGSIPIVVALYVTILPTMRQPLSDYIRYIYVHHRTLSDKAVGFGNRVQYLGHYVCIWSDNHTSR
jgi:hypothetical protein